MTAQPYRFHSFIQRIVSLLKVERLALFPSKPSGEPISRWCPLERHSQLHGIFLPPYKTRSVRRKELSGEV
jgi:hypothetical protein